MIEGRFDLSELIQLTIAETGEPVNVVDEVVKTALKILSIKISELGHAQLHNFGSFSIRELAPESGTTPQGEHYEVGKRITVDFDPAKAFRETLTRINDIPAIA